ncbi:unnamed protein product [Adineta steineri]|uniref:G-protein coupled receptors family 1 profile domain-containing protein n=1 Tax=Adineta steineri TaxID=433720 RepID=A0A813V9W6_9BILA|nr:unnamed protein product [Adineta steineri]CAF0862804.1 unnamed protein product [Adineta steineri]CAF4230120.1 unnamed protein product [Adineta steineri]
MGINMGYDLARTTPSLCKFRAYGFVFSIVLARHFLCLISLDRWMVTSKWVWLRQKSSPKIARWLISLSFIFWMLFTIHVPIGYQSIPTIGCIPPPRSNYQLFYSIYAIVISVIPFLIMVVFSIVTLQSIRQLGRAVHPEPITKTVTGSTCQNPQQQQRHKIKKESQFIRLSFLQITFFILLNSMTSSLPLYTFATSWQIKSADQQAIILFISNLGVCLMHTYAAVCFPFFIFRKR